MHQITDWRFLHCELVVIDVMNWDRTRSLMSNELKRIAYMVVVPLVRTRLNCHSTPNYFVTRLLNRKLQISLRYLKLNMFVRHIQQYFMSDKSCGHFHHFLCPLRTTKKSKFQEEVSSKLEFAYRTFMPCPCFYNLKNTLNGQT